jgi:hypothetical protein
VGDADALGDEVLGLVLGVEDGSAVHMTSQVTGHRPSKRWPSFVERGHRFDASFATHGQSRLLEPT